MVTAEQSQKITSEILDLTIRLDILRERIMTMVLAGHIRPEFAIKMLERLDKELKILQGLRT